MDVKEKVLKVLVELLGKKVEEIQLESKIVEELGADELDLVEVVMELEEQLEITIPDECAEKVVTVEDLIKVCETNCSTPTEPTEEQKKEALKARAVAVGLAEDATEEEIVAKETEKEGTE